jgi:hypothetical protein
MKSTRGTAHRPPSSGWRAFCTFSVFIGVYLRFLPVSWWVTALSVSGARPGVGPGRAGYRRRQTAPPGVDDLQPWIGDFVHGAERQTRPGATSSRYGPPSGPANRVAGEKGAPGPGGLRHHHRQLHRTQDGRGQAAGIGGARSSLRAPLVVTSAVPGRLRLLVSSVRSARRA